ncbi:MAG: hypothetical protein OEZ06_12485 [Myxococcales bacterium]|nr:hypothetical protein [Myxococcales bacterium]
MAEQAIALLAHGRTREAGALVAMLPPAAGGGLRAKAETKAFAPAASPIEQAHAIWGVLGDEPNTPKVSFPPPTPEHLDPELDAATRRQLSRGHAEALDWLHRGEPKRAVTALSALPSALLQHAGAPMGYLRGYLHYRAGQYDEAIDTLEATLQADPAFALEHPALYFFLARSHDALMHFDKAVRNAQVYIEAAPLWAGGADDEAQPEPPPNAAPISDEAGETLKQFHSDRAGAVAEASGHAQAP